jgi:outer membrane lipopolysaccharide assembly protein LptE/RlpB
MGLRKLIAPAAACLFLAHCGYYLRGTGSSLPPNIKKIGVPMFKNLTTRFDLDVKLTQNVVNELVARGKTEVVTDSSGVDAVLIGEINSFNVNAIAFSDQNMADRYTITVVAKIVFRDLTSQKILFSNSSYVYQEQYEVPPGTSYETWETQALDTVAEKFARSLVSTLLEGF